METLAPAPAVAPAPQQRSYRIGSIDLLRGVVMIIMALDHARDLLHFGALTEDPLNLQTTTVWLFGTRWITHFCAPVFVFLSGTSIYLQSLRKSRSQLSLFLLKRGLWLVLVELTLVTFGISFDPSWGAVFLQVIWAIGISMVLLAAFIWLPFWAILAIGLVVVLGHNSLDAWEEKNAAQLPLWYHLLHRQAFVPMGSDRFLAVFYPFLPWTGLMLLGYCFGRVCRLAPVQRRKYTALMGGALVLFFIALRYTNAYGDPLPWQVQPTGLRTVLSFINTQKYPPSLLYLCITIGPALLFMALADGWRNKFARVVSVFGQVPFFYYLLHFYLIHLVSVALFVGRGGSFSEGFAGAPGVPFKFVVPGVGLHLWQVYLVWMAVVLALYPLCRWYARYKQNYRHWWLSYL